MRWMFIILVILVIMEGCAKRQTLPSPQPQHKLVMVAEPALPPEPPGLRMLGAAPKLEPIQVVVYFDFDSDQLRPATLETIGGIAQYANGRSVRLVGGACPIGTAAYNEGLGLRRAKAIEKALQNVGVVATSVESVGEKILVSSLPNCYYLNRRCEIIME